MAADLKLIGPGLIAEGGPFAAWQQQLNENVLGISVGGVGDQLAKTEATQVLADLQNKLATFPATTTTVAEVKAQLESALAGLLSGEINVLGDDGGDDIRFQLSLGGSNEGTVDFLVGVGDTTPIKVSSGHEGAVDLKVDWTLTLTIGVNEGDGFFVSSELENELKLEVGATIKEDARLLGRMGLTFGDYKPIEDKTEIFKGEYSVDLKSPGQDGLLTPAEYDQAGVQGVLDGEATITLRGVGSFLPKGLDILDMFNLGFSADVSVHKVYTEADPSATIFGSPVSTGFEDVRLDLGTFYNEFVTSIVGGIRDALDPILPVFDMLFEPIPVVGGFLATLQGRDEPLTLLDLGRPFYIATSKLPNPGQRWDSMVSLIRLLRDLLDNPVPTTDQVLELGSFVTTEKKKVVDARPNTQALEQVKKEPKAGKFVKEYGAALKFPILENPLKAFEILVGNPDIELFTLDVNLDIGFVYEDFFPLFWALGFNIKAGFNLKVDAGLGYDSRGLVDFVNGLDFDDLANSAESSAPLLLNGFYLNDGNDGGPDGNRSNDRPEMTFTIIAGAGPSIGFDLGFLELSAGATLIISANLYLDFNDLPNAPADASTPPSEYEYDGKIRLGEFERILRFDPVALFNISGDIRASLEIYFRLRLGPFTIFDFEHELFNETIIDFQIPIPTDQEILAQESRLGPPQLGFVDSLGTLTLFTGPLSSGRNILKDKIAEDIRIESVDYDPITGTETVLVTAFRVFEQEFKGVKRIEVDTSSTETGKLKDNDSIVVGKGIRSNARIKGGAGKDRLRYLGLGSAEIHGGDGDDQIYGSDGNDLIVGGFGNDVIYAGGGDDVVYGDDQRVFILGGGLATAIGVYSSALFDDQIEGGAGNDQIFGGFGADRVRGGDGADKLFGDLHPDDLANGMELGGRPFLDYLAPFLGDSLFGGADDDELRGSYGDDRLDGEEGLDLLFGQAGGDRFVVYVGQGHDAIDGGDASYRETSDEVFADEVLVLGGRAIQSVRRDSGKFDTTVAELQDLLSITGDASQVILSSDVDGSRVFTAAAIRGVGLVLGGGSDRFTVNDLSATALKYINADLSIPGDESTEGDTIILNGGPGSDALEVRARFEKVPTTKVDSEGNLVSGGLMEKPVFQFAPIDGGAGPVVLIQNSKPKRDLLLIRTHGGNDKVTIAPRDTVAQVAALDLIDIQIEAGEGNDILKGTDGSNLKFLAGLGDDVIEAGPGNSVIGGEGNDALTFTGVRPFPDGPYSWTLTSSSLSAVYPDPEAEELFGRFESIESLSLRMPDSTTRPGSRNELVVESTPAGIPLVISTGDGPQGDLVRIERLAHPASVFLGAGDDRIEIGDGTLEQIAAQLTFEAGLGFDTVAFLAFDDSEDRVVTVGDSEVSGLGSVVPIRYGSDVERVEVSLGEGDDVVNVPNPIRRVLVKGGLGRDSAFVHFAQPFSGNAEGPGLETTGVEFNQFEDRNASDGVWVIRDGKLFAKEQAVLSVLDRTATSLLLLSEEGNDQVVVREVNHATTVRGRGGNDRFQVGDNESPLSRILDRVLFEGGTGTNELTIEARAGRVDADSPGRHDVGSVKGMEMTGHVAYAELSQVVVRLGDANDEFRVDGTSVPLQILTGGGKDKVTVFGAGADVRVTGGEGADTVIVDRSASVAALVGAASIGPDGAAVVSGLGFAGAVSTVEVDDLTVTLGGNNDQFEVSDVPAGVLLRVQGGGGDDVVKIAGTMLAGQVFVDGQAGEDTVEVWLPPGVSFASNLVETLRVGVETLLVENSINRSWVNWELADEVLLAGGSPVVSTAGAARTRIRSGSGIDSLSVRSESQASASAVIDGNRIELEQGAQVLSQDDFLHDDSLSVPIPIDGLDGASGVRESSDGRYVFVAATGDHSLTVFRRAAGSGKLRPVAAIRDPDDDLGLKGAELLELVDDRHLYVRGANQIAVVRWNVATESLEVVHRIRPGLAPFGEVTSIGSMTVSADSRNLYFHDPASIRLWATRINAADGALSVVNSVNSYESVGELVVAPDGSRVFGQARREGDDLRLLVVWGRDASGDGRLSLVERPSFTDKNIMPDTNLLGGISPDGRFGYFIARSISRGDILVFERDPASGEFKNLVQRVPLSFWEADETTRLRTVTIFNEADSPIVFAPDGRTIYFGTRAAHSTNDVRFQIVTMRRDSQTGRLSLLQVIEDIAGSAGMSRTGTMAIEGVSPDGSILAVTIRDSANRGRVLQFGIGADGVPGSFDLDYRSTEVEFASGRDRVTFSLDGSTLHILGKSTLASTSVDPARSIHYMRRTGSWFQPQQPFPNSPFFLENLTPSAILAVAPLSAETSFLFRDSVLLLTADNRLTLFSPFFSSLGSFATLSDQGPAFPEIDPYFGLRPTSVSLTVSPDGQWLLITGSWSTGPTNLAARYLTRRIVTSPSAAPSLGQPRVVIDGPFGPTPDATRVFFGPDSQYFYVSSATERTLSTYEFNRSDGNLAFEQKQNQFNLYPGLSGAKAIDVSPDGSRIYVASENDAIAVFEYRSDFSQSLPGGGSSPFHELYPLQILGQDAEGPIDPTDIALDRAAGGTAVYVTTSTGIRVYERQADGRLVYRSRIDNGSPGAPVGLSGLARIFLGANGTTLLGVSPTADSLADLVRGTQGALRVRQVLIDGQTFNFAPIGIENVVGSADGRFLYALSPVDGALLVVEPKNSNKVRQGFVDGSVPTGGTAAMSGLTGASSVAISPDGGFLLVGSPSSRSVIVFRIATDGTLGLPREYRNSQFAGGVRSILPIKLGGEILAVSAEDGTVGLYQLVGQNGDLQQVRLDQRGTARLLATSPDGAVLYGSDPTRNTLVVLHLDPDFPELGHQVVQSVPDGVGGAVGLGGISSAALSPDGKHLYVAARLDHSVTVFEVGPQGKLTLVQTLREGRQGVRGIKGASSIAVSADGKYVLVAGSDSDAVAVLERKSDTGRLVFAQALRNGTGGSGGLESPSALVLGPDGKTVYVASAAGIGAESGGLARFHINIPAPAPTRTVVTFEGIESLGLYLTGGDATVSQNRAATVGFTWIQTSGAADLVTLNDLSSETVVSLGGGDDVIDLRSTRTSTILQVKGEAGKDLIRLWSSASDARTTLEGGDDDDLFVVNGREIWSPVDVRGDAPTASPTGDVIEYSSGDLAMESGPPLAGNGVLKAEGRAEVRYQSIEGFPAPLPTLFAVAGGPYAISEGDALPLNSVGSIVPGTALYEWDLDGDGVFGDALGPNPTVAWSELVALGLGDDGRYQVALQITTEDERVSVATASLHITDKAPLLSIDAQPAVALGHPWTVRFSASDPGDDPISRWTIEWGDGKTESFGSTATQAVHIYDAPGPRVARIIAETEEGVFHVFANVEVVFVPSSISLGGPYSILEGQGVSFSAVIPGSPISFEWDVNGDGLGDFGGQHLSLTWAQLGLVGLGDSGTYEIRAVASYDGWNLVEILPAVLTIENVGPRGSATNTGPVLEGGTARVQVSPTIVEPSDIDRAAGFRFSYDFDNNGVFEVVDSSSRDQEVPASFLADGPFTRTVRIRVADKDGGYRDMLTNIIVNNVAPSVSIQGASSIGEGATYRLALSAIDPGNDPVRQWEIEWGDGAREIVLGHPSTTPHVYAKPGVYTITAVAVDDDGSHPAQSALTVTVIDVLPTISLAGDGRTVEGSFYRLGLASSGEKVVEWVVDWGDGKPAERFVGDLPAVTHQYPDGPKPFSIVVRAVDDEGNWVRADHVVEVANVAPILAILGAPQVDEGSLYSLTLDTLSDPGDDHVVEYQIDWGDGEITRTPDRGTHTHRYADGRTTRTISVSVVDEDGLHPATASARLAVEIRDVAPTMTLKAPARVFRNASFVLELGNVADPGADLVHEYFIDWGDGEVTRTAPTSAVAHVYRGVPGVRTILVAVSDEEGTYTVGQVQVEVVAAPPRVEVTGPATVVGGQPINLTIGSVFNVEPGAVTGFRIRWGDNTTTIVNQPGTVPHTYGQNPFQYRVSVDILVGAQVHLNAGGIDIKTTAPLVEGIALSNASIKENSAAGALVGTLSAIGGPSAAAYSFTLLDNAGGRFRVVGNRVEVAPGASLDFETAASHPIRVLMTGAGASLERTIVIQVADINEVVGFKVQRGVTQRSFVRYLDIALEDADGVEDLVRNSRVRLKRFDLEGENGVDVPLAQGVLSSAGAGVSFDFGAQGIGGNRNSNVGDGYYTVLIDTDGDGEFETTRSFYRLLGDVDGDRSVTAVDSYLVYLAYGQTGTNHFLDVNGDTVVNAQDRLLVNRNLGRRLSSRLRLDG